MLKMTSWKMHILLQISCIDRVHKSVKNYENCLTIGKGIAIIQRMTFYRTILWCLLSDLALPPLQKRPFQLAKMPKKYAISTLIFENFLGA